jgi:hypothetical protein
MLPIADMRHVVAAERTTRVGPGEGRACPRGIERLAMKRARHDAGGRQHGTEGAAITLARPPRPDPGPGGYRSADYGPSAATRDRALSCARCR